MKIPKKVTIMDGYVELDGGTTSILCNDEDNNDVEILLNFSIEDQNNNNCQLLLNNNKIEKRSESESKILKSLKNAFFFDETKEDTKKDLIIDNDLKVLNEEHNFLVEITNNIIKNIESDIYCKK